MAFGRAGTGVVLRGNLRWKVEGGPRTLQSGAVVKGPETVLAILQHFAQTAHPEAMRSASHRLAQEMAEHARANAPWQDRTGNARSLLHPVVSEQGGRFSGGVAHGVDYGIWLEVRWNGRYAILLPTQEVFQAKASAVFAEEFRLVSETGQASGFRATGAEEVAA